MEPTIIAAMSLFGIAAVQDGATGQVFAPLLLASAAVLGLFLPVSFTAIYLPVLAVMLLIWLGLRQLPEAAKQAGITMGFGDVLGVPVAISIAHAANPFWGPVSFALVYAATLPVFVRKNARRLLPWLVAPTATALMISLLL